MSSATLESTSPQLDDVLRRADQISTLPQIAVKVMKIANDPNSSAADLKQAMECDVALSARVLRCVNSSAYAVRTKITNLQQAIAYLGMKQIRNLAMTATVSQMFKQDDSCGTYRRTGLWRHLVSVGLCARLVAMRLKFPNFEDMFLAGLMHDIGIVFEDQYAHPDFVAVVQSLDPAKTLCDIERHHLQFDHTQLGERIAQQWGFPDSVIAAIRHHHAPAAYKGEHVNLLRCVDLANLICSLKKISSVGVPLVKLCPTTMTSLGFGRQDLAVLGEDLDREIQQNASLFQVQA